MSDLDLIERAKGSEYFSGARLADDLERFLAEESERLRELGGAISPGTTSSTTSRCTG